MNSFQKQELDFFKEHHKKSFFLWNRSLTKFPGGINHNNRTLGLPLIEAYPVFMSNSSAITLTDVDNNTYTDYWLGHYSQILGHHYPAISKAISDQLEKGWMFGTVNEQQVIFAEKISSISKTIEEMRFQTSGSESVMNALRLACAYTNRNVIAKVDLGWHGANETMNNGLSHKIIEVEDTESLSGQKIVTFRLTQHSIDHLFKEFGYKLACVIIEPVIGSGGAFQVDIELLKLIRESCDTYGVVLIFDEIITGFRFQYGLYQDKIKVYSDLTTIGKVLGGGFPIGGLGGLEEIMELANPSTNKPNKVVIGGGTYSCHPVTMNAGIATLNVLASKKEEYDRLNELGDYFRSQLNEIFSGQNQKILTSNYGSLLFINCLKGNPWEMEIPVIEIMNSIDKKEQAFLQLALLNRQIYGNHGIGSLSFLHTKQTIDMTINIVNEIVSASKT